MSRNLLVNEVNNSVGFEKETMRFASSIKDLKVFCLPFLADELFLKLRCTLLSFDIRAANDSLCKSYFGVL